MLGEMSTEYQTNRWWENYLVRYLMPSIAGVVVVSWLCWHAGGQLRSLLLLPPVGRALDTPSLTLFFLYGNLFCYVASYPVLSFHVTRVLDFVDGKWPAHAVSDGYIVSTCLAAAAFTLSSICPPGLWRYWIAFALVTGFAAVQLYRMYSALSRRITVRGLLGTVSPAFGLAYALARRRGIPEEIKTTSSSGSQAPGTAGTSVGEEEDEEITKHQRIQWRPELIATYRHLREHGNSAFIFLLELTLAALVYCVITKPGESAEEQLGAVAGLFAIWAIPAAFVHLVGQLLKRRFSKFDIDRLTSAMPGANRRHK
jgi:predicted membrane protein